MNDHSTDGGSGDAELAALEAKINELLPPRYAGCFEDVAPSSMGSAPLRYDAQGRVAWGEIWTTFCHLALAGGPPHRGQLLGPVAADDVRNAPEPYEGVVAELERAFGLCVDLPLVPARQPGWIGLECDDGATASWLVRAIVAENVIARHEGKALYVPAGPGFRVEKEIKNVVVCVAKSCHYLFDHLEPEQQPTGAARPLIGPPLPHEIAAAGERYEAAAVLLQERIREATGMATLLGDAPGWVGVRCESEEAAVWMLRAVAVENVLVRREEATLYVPVAVCPDSERRPDGEGGSDAGWPNAGGLHAGGAIGRTVAAVVAAHRLWRYRVNKTGVAKTDVLKNRAEKN